MGRILVSLAVAGAIPAYAGSVSGSDWTELGLAILTAIVGWLAGVLGRRPNIDK